MRVKASPSIVLRITCSVDSLDHTARSTSGRVEIAAATSARLRSMDAGPAGAASAAGAGGACAGVTICEALKFGPEKTVRRLQELHAGIQS